MPRSGTRKYCSVFGCLNSSNSNPQLSLFRIPNDLERRQEWLRLINREDLLIRTHASDNGINQKISYHTVCEEHFDVSCIIQNETRKVLKKNTIPTLKLPMTSDVDAPSSCRRPTNRYRIKQDAETQTDKPILKDNFVQTKNWRVVQHQAVQTIDKYGNGRKRKRKLDPEAETDPLSITEEEEDEEEDTEESEENQKMMFHKLCDKFLPKKLAKLVKAQTD